MKKPSSDFIYEKLLIILISLGFASWGGAFIHKSSFITLDGRRSFSLFDDAMISMRYAWNFSHGNGLVWNPGEYVQGYTNLLMILLMSLATLVFSKTMAVLFIQITGIVFMLMVAYLTMEIAGHIIQAPDQGSRAFIRVLSFLFGLAYYPLAYWSLMGMETGLQTALVLAGILMSFRYVQSQDPKAFLLSAVSFGLAFLTRNETILFVPLAWGYVFWELTGTGVDRRFPRHLTAAFGLYLLFVVGQLTFQFLYYGEYLPNTYILKLTGLTLSQRIQNGMGFVTVFLRDAWILLALAALGALINLKKNKLMLLTGIIAAIGYQIYVGGDVWAYWRLVAPVIPLAMILNIAVLFGGAGRLLSGSPQGKSPSPARGRKFLAAFLVIMLILPGIWLANSDFLNEALLQDKAFMVVDNKENVNKAIALNELLREDATIGVIMAGVIPYYVDRNAVDFLGKSDRYIAQLPPDTYRDVKHIGMLSVPGHNKYDLYYSIVLLRPTYVEKLAFGRDDLSAWGEDNYVKVIYKGNTLYLLKDSPSVFWSKLEASRQ